MIPEKDPEWVNGVAQVIGDKPVDTAPRSLDADHITEVGKMVPNPDRPFDVVWCSAENAADAVRALALLPGGDDERRERHKLHHFRMWERVPAFTLDGRRTGGAWMCITTDRRSSECLHPGAIDAGRVLVVDLCEKLVEVKPGFIGGWLKADIWARPDFVKAAAETAESEKIKAENADKIELARVEESNRLRQSAARRYFVTGGRMVLPATAADPVKLDNNALVDVMAWGSLLGVPMVPLDTWMEQMGPAEPKQADDGPYDPVTFLAHAQHMAECAQNM